MTPTLPSVPNLEQQHKRAKTLLRQHRQGDSSCCDTLRCHELLAGKNDQEILHSRLTLAQSRHALARSYGFRNWAELKRYIEEARSPSAITGSGAIRIPEYQGEPIDLERHHPAVEIKGATYTELAVLRKDGHWTAQCVVDV